MKKTTLTVEPRNLEGRKVKQLRKEGKIPANIFGKQTKSLSVQVTLDAFTKVFKQVGETSLLDLQVGSETRPVLIQNVQVHPVSGAVLHVDFRQVDLKEKVKAHVPLVVSGDAPAVSEKLGVLLTLLDELEVEALPTDLPEKLEVSVASLTKLHDSVKVKDLTLPKGVTALVDPDSEIVKIGDLVTKEAEKQAQEEEAAKLAAAAETAAATTPPTDAAVPEKAPEPVTAKSTDQPKPEK